MFGFRSSPACLLKLLAISILKFDSRNRRIQTFLVGNGRISDSLFRSWSFKRAIALACMLNTILLQLQNGSESKALKARQALRIVVEAEDLLGDKVNEHDPAAWLKILCRHMRMIGKMFISLSNTHIQYTS